ncbi:hypothetical protein BC939DRAFT_139541 [Gamsiella multidivaricata]|uniref:uncharacterized protein n=1 Tax=Gamsiella multidivaricata TaxID=101098 RepID=UPI002220DEAB|nr:uncharacterized protein BC939DRAFT_139541 [Gamsiella multidivaricata]KAI7824701.1 hypothetical protein BC939DRAFT_139541 [Gamsiella multidivaricata]
MFTIERIIIYISLLFLRNSTTHNMHYSSTSSFSTMSISFSKQRSAPPPSLTTLRTTAADTATTGATKAFTAYTITLALLLAFALPPSTHAQTNLGCYASDLTRATTHDNTPSRTHRPLLPELSPSYHDIYMTQDACSAYCKSNRFLHGITAGGTTCYCSNQLFLQGNKVDDGRRDKSCAGYPFETYGSKSTLIGKQQDGVETEGDSYANVALVGSSLLVQSSTLPSRYSKPERTRGSSSDREDRKEMSIETVVQPPRSSPTNTPTTALAAAVERTVGLRLQIRNNSEDPTESDASAVDNKEDLGQDDADEEDDGEDNDNDDGGDGGEEEDKCK